MSKWIRVDATSDSHPKFMRAGFWGGTVVRAMWRLAKNFDCKDGNITKFWDAEYLVMLLRLDDEEIFENVKIDPEYYISIGMGMAISAGLIEQIGDQVFIHDWQDFQRAEGYERLKRHREKKRMITDDNAAETDDNTDNISNNVITDDNAAETDDNTDNISNNVITDETVNMTEQNITEHNRTKKRKRSLVSLSPAYTSRADRLRESILAYKSDHRVASEEAYSKVLTKWSEDIRKLHEKDGISMDRIDAVLRWLPSDPFWPPNIQSGAALRKHWDRLEDECRKCSRPGEQTDEERKESVRKCREMGMIIFSADDEPDPDPEEITND